MSKLEFDTAACAFNYYLRNLDDAPIQSPRGSETKELLNESFTIKRPRARLIYHNGRSYNLSFNIAELLSFISGINSTKAISYYNPTIKNFSDNNLVLYGAYGPRIQPYLKRIIEKLRNNPDTRQAVINIYKSEDCFVDTKDTPCTVSIDFKLRDNKLYMHTYMRSNDLIWGFQYDVFAFTVLQEIIAHELGVKLGDYTHTTSSMHIYKKHWDLLKTSANPVTMPRLMIDYEEALKTANFSIQLAHKSPETKAQTNIDFAEYPANDLVAALINDKISYDNPTDYYYRDLEWYRVIKNGR